VVEQLARRVFLGSLGALGAGATIGLRVRAAWGQSSAPRRIGVLLVGWSPESPGPQQFRHGILDAGYVEGRDVVIEWRSADGDYNRVPELVADLVRSKVDVS
jgi:putative ABC transport system substrate-binding protein